MPPKTPAGAGGEDNGFTFLVTTNPGKPSAAHSRRVRSAAATKSWPERRKRTFEQLEGSRSSSNAASIESASQALAPAVSETQRREHDAQSSILSSGRAHYQAQDRLPLQRKRPAWDANTQASSGTRDPPSRYATSTYARLETLGSRNDLPGFDEQREHNNNATSRPHLIPQSRRRNVKKIAEGQSHFAFPTPPATPPVPVSVTDMAEPFNCYPVPYRRWFDSLLYHMMHSFAPRGWPALKITNEQGMKWEWFMTQHALSAPALFYVRLLFASGDLIRMNVLKPEIQYWLRAQAIAAINEALQDPKRATSTPLILAVGRIAFHESMYGDRNAANTIHRPAQQRMIQMRGGMKALVEVPELVKRLMRMVDGIMSKQSGVPRFLEDDEGGANFSESQSVTVLEKWVPKEGQELRRKIKVSDLVNN